MDQRLPPLGTTKSDLTVDYCLLSALGNIGVCNAIVSCRCIWRWSINAVLAILPILEKLDPVLVDSIP